MSIEEYEKYSKLKSLSLFKLHGEWFKNCLKSSLFFLNNRSNRNMEFLSYIINKFIKQCISNCNKKINKGIYKKLEKSLSNKIIDKEFLKEITQLENKV